LQSAWGRANANITLSIYAHALEADEIAAAEIWHDSMAHLIAEYNREPNPTLANVSAERALKLEIFERKR
jgi:hypothetical protein